MEMFYEPERRYSKNELSIEPDLGDLRRSTDKALPGLPKTPKRVLMKYRFSAVFPIVFTVAGFILILVLVVAGKDAYTFGGQYLVALEIPTNTQASAPQNAIPSESPASTKQTETANIYYLYLQKVCSGSPSHGAKRISSIVAERCESYSMATARLGTLTSSGSALSNNPISSMDIVTRLVVMTSNALHGMRIGSFASLVVSLIASLLSAISAIPAIFFPHSRLLAYFNIFWPLLASTFAFIAASILTILIAGVFGAVEIVIHGAHLKAEQGRSALLIAWLAWVLVSLPMIYWSLVWFVEVRMWSFTKRRRSDDEVGNWKGIGREVWKDLKSDDRKVFYVNTSHK